MWPIWWRRADRRVWSEATTPLIGQPEVVIADLAHTQVLGQGVEPMRALTVVDGDTRPTAAVQAYNTGSGRRSLTLSDRDALAR